ncbi:Prephenate dehydratase-domain-containing protein [Cantharellus anzutake]|uniref:Prephenate dehydratase-domain-containing protein n=1 Tax=Cantharellus anzutake TaxID=1750568 RepID=UPI001904EE06|nr:Prephenate dehydratase-domain-containing protein [Cantharellus anzutake]KAF8339072.1 Prephenate dehydratase-domain-containing protein [Cantharellus anzutake]
MVQLHNESSPQPELAYLGPEGTYSHQAAYELCGDSVRYEPRSSIRDLGVSITDPNRTARFAFIPLENSTFGSVVETYDILRHPALGKTAFIRGEQILSVRHCLIALPGTKIEDITSVSSHEQALGQCTEYVRRVLPNATKVPVTSTAFAAKSLLEHADDVVYNRAAISAAICAKLYGLVILEEGIQDGEANQTRFLLFHDSADEPLPLDIRPPLQYRSLLRIQLDDICKPHPAGSYLILPSPRPCQDCFGPSSHDNAN